MSWRERLQKASFRNVSFHVEEDELTAGRRSQTHEYPMRDEPNTEDLGRAKREFTITGFVIGENCYEQRDALLAAIEKGGAGTLVHPWYGEKQVNALSCTVRHSNENGGMAIFSLAFVEAGKLAFPSATVSTPALSLSSAAALEEAAKSQFSSMFKAVGLSSWVEAAAISSFGAALLSGTPTLSSIPGFGGDARSLAGEISGLVGFPSTLATRVFDLFRGRATTAADAARTSRSLLAVQSAEALANPLAAPLSSTPQRLQQVDNATAINTLVRQAALVEVVRATAAMPATVFDDTIALRNGTMAAMDKEAKTANDTMFEVLTAARRAVYQDLTERSRDSARLETLKPQGVTPALVLAYRKYADAGRAEEIIARNHIVHPGFVPVADLKVLSQ